MRGKGIGTAAACLALVVPAHALAAKKDVSAGQSIQAAIATASAGDEIDVHAGVYTERITVDKQLTIKGDARGNTFLAPATGQGDTVTVSGAGVAISNLSIFVPGGAGHA